MEATASTSSSSPPSLLLLVLVVWKGKGREFKGNWELGNEEKREESVLFFHRKMFGFFGLLVWLGVGNWREYEYAVNKKNREREREREREKRVMVAFEFVFNGFMSLSM